MGNFHEKIRTLKSFTAEVAQSTPWLNAWPHNFRTNCDWAHLRKVAVMVERPVRYGGRGCPPLHARRVRSPFAEEIREPPLR
jgi:hypothetical protein